MSAPYVFAYFLDQARPAYLRLLRIHLQTLRTHGGEAAGYPRFLMYGGELSGREGEPIREFARREGVEIVPAALPFDYPLANKTTLCQVPEGDVACLIDVDTLVLGDPTPAFEEAARERVFLAALAPTSPVRRAGGIWAAGPWAAPVNALRELLGQRAWGELYHRYGAGAPPPPRLRNLEGRWIYPYFNSGVCISPREYLPELERIMVQVAGDLERERRRGGRRAALLQLNHVHQLALGVAVHAAGIPWQPLSYMYNFGNGCAKAPALRGAVEEGRVKVMHLVRSVRPYLQAGFAGRVPPELRAFVAVARQAIAEADRVAASAVG